MKKIILILCLLPLSVFAQPDSVLSGVYDWKKPETKTERNIRSSVLFEGMTYDMKWMKLSCSSVSASKKKNEMIVPADEEQILIIKKGQLDVTLKGDVFHLIPGSVIVLLPGERISFLTPQKTACAFFRIQYKSKVPMDKERGEKAGGSFIKDFSKIEFKPHDKGGIRNYFERPTAMGKRLEMHVTTLNGGLKSHDPHTHRAEEIILMIKGNTEMQIGEGFYQGTEGSLFYLGSGIPHAIRNTETEPCMYFAFQFE